MSNIININGGRGSSSGGSAGKDGITPHIDETTGNWFLGETDTGVKATGTDGEDGISPHIDETTGNWFIGETDTGVKATGSDGTTPHIDETTGNWFIGDTDTGIKALGQDGQDGITPHIGTDGYWYLGTTNTGVKAEAESDARIETVTLLASGWDSETLTQTISVEGVLEDELKQVITIVATPDSETAYDDAEVYCASHAADSLTFKATTVPTEDISVYVVLETVNGSGNNSSDNVYSLEETVVGTWIDGKPIYRISVYGVTGVRNSDNDMLFYVPTLKSIDRLISLSGGLNAEGNYILHYGTMVQTTVHNAGYIVVKADSTYWENRDANYTIEYTKTTDTATIEIPSATALNEAYDEGVNEA